MSRPICPTTIFMSSLPARSPTYHVLLRDHLRSHPDAAERYGQRKLEVAHLITGESRQAYMDAKASIVEELLATARREFAL
jgi:GrpB-like predicted nucleotidyltransferase (UPF0157 family)